MNTGHKVWEWTKRNTKEVGKVLLIAGILTLAVRGLQYGKSAWFAAALAGIGALLYWNELGLRRLKIGPVEVERDVTPASAPAMGVPESREDFGKVRDNFIFLANQHYAFWDAQRSANQDGNRDLVMALQFYRCAHRMKKSILTAFRSLQCLCWMPNAAAEHGNEIREWFNDAVWLASGPHGDLENRMQFVKRVREIDAKPHDASFTETIVQVMRNSGI